MITTDSVPIHRLARAAPAASNDGRNGQRVAAPHAPQEPTGGANDVAGRADHPVTGKVFALKDGSGYAMQGSDGRYYRLKTGAGDAGGTTVSSRSIEAALVDVVAGAVSRLRAAGTEMPGIGGRTVPPLAGRGEAIHAAHDMHALIARHPALARRSQVSVDPVTALALLR